MIMSLSMNCIGSRLIETNWCIAPPEIVKQHFYVKYDSCNIPLPLASVYGILNCSFFVKLGFGVY